MEVPLIPPSLSEGKVALLDHDDDDVHEEQKCTTNLDEDVSEFDLFGDEDEPPVKKARPSNAEGKRPAA